MKKSLWLFVRLLCFSILVLATSLEIVYTKIIGFALLFFGSVAIYYFIMHTPKWMKRIGETESEARA